MNLQPDRTAPIRNIIVVFTFILLMLACVIGISIEGTMSVEMGNFLVPTLTTITIFILFASVLKRQVGDNLFGELGFLYLGLLVAYTVFPACTFMFDSLEQGDPLAQLSPTSAALAIHLWRHVLFVFGVAAGYLLVRGREITTLVMVKDLRNKDGRTVVFLIVLLSICILSIVLMSAPVYSYLDHYTRFDHLPWLARKFVSLCIRLKLGIYMILITFLFLNYKKYRFLIPIAVVTLCIYEMIYSWGARIDSFIILLGATCLYNFTVKSISLKKGMMVCGALVLLFSLVELFRVLNYDFELTETMVLQQGLKFAAEFGSVYYPGFHLYTERAQGSIPLVEWPMFFNDFISLVTFGDFVRWNPMDWYTRNYHPSLFIPPFTLGPIADSAIWGGEIDLFLRSLINGAFFAYLVRWFLRHKDRWWGVAIYVYCYATCILTLKYSIFYHLYPLVKTMLPTMLLVGGLRMMISSKQRTWLSKSD